MLKLDNIHTYYGKSHILHGVCLEVGENSEVALSGRNGVGKTTTLRSIFGFTPPREGVIKFEGVDITGLPPYQIGRMGITLAPQGRRIFPSLTVRENLAIAAFNNSKLSRSSNLEKIFSLFPVLRERSNLRAKTLSGGEMQMLAIGRALMAAPKLLLMDEPTEGLAPLLVQEIKQVILSIKSEKKTSLLLVEQNFSLILEVADYVYVMSKGSVVYESKPKDLMNNEEIKVKYLGLRK
jgi:branched-chain amino acid transport system ATP-binding protein